MYATKNVVKLSAWAGEIIEDLKFEFQQHCPQKTCVPVAWMGTVAGIVMSISMLSLILVIKGA